MQKSTTKDLHGYLENTNDSTTIPKLTLFEVEVTASTSLLPCHLSFSHSYWNIKPHDSGVLVSATNREKKLLTSRDIPEKINMREIYASSVAVELKRLGGS